MAYIDPYSGTKAGVLAKFSFKMVTDEDLEVDNSEVGFDGELDYAYSVERFDEDKMEGNVWVWVSDDSDIDILKAHSSFIGDSLLRDIR